MEKQDREDSFNLNQFFLNEKEEEKSQSPSSKTGTTIHTFQRDPQKITHSKDVHELKIQLINHHSLWAHCLWNAGLALANYFDAHPSIVQNKYVIEFGAGAALPSFISILNGATRTVITDYPESELLNNISINLSNNVSSLSKDDSKALVKGFRWDHQHTIKELLNLTPNGQGYDILILSDLIFNHSQHEALLRACYALLKIPQGGNATSSLPDDSFGTIYCVFTHHRPHLASRDMNFFELAQKEPFHFKVNCLFIDETNYQPMFPNDIGDPKVRSQVHFYTLSR